MSSQTISDNFFVIVTVAEQHNEQLPGAVEKGANYKNEFHCVGCGKELVLHLVVIGKLDMTIFQLVSLGENHV